MLDRAPMAQEAPQASILELLSKGYGVEDIAALKRLSAALVRHKVWCLHPEELANAITESRAEMKRRVKV